MLEYFSYCPTLHTRAAEISALSQLPPETKNRIFPLIVARPWQNANLLEMTWAKIYEALGNRRFALDLDLTKKNVITKRVASQEFNDLFNAANGFGAYYEQVSKLPQAIPVLRLGGVGVPQLSEQLKHVEIIDRGAVLRLEFGLVQNPSDIAVDVLKRLEDVSIFIDVGWSRHLLEREVWASSIIKAISDLRPEVEIVLTGSSFPDSFSSLGRRGENAIAERFLYNNLIRRHNSAVIIYGDWGSTRPPSAPIPMTPVPRIDLPTSANWISFRRDSNTPIFETYIDIARRTVSDNAWPQDIEIWGTQAIKWTAQGEPGAINSPHAASAARINIHLHQQAFFGEGGAANDTDEPFTDDF